MSSDGYLDKEQSGDATSDKKYLSTQSDDNEESNSVGESDVLDGNDAHETSQKIAQASAHTYNLRRLRDATSVCHKTYAAIKSGASYHNTKVMT
jgi:hypothetical protein